MSNRNGMERETLKRLQQPLLRIWWHFCCHDIDKLCALAQSERLKIYASSLLEIYSNCASPLNDGASTFPFWRLLCARTRHPSRWCWAILTARTDDEWACLWTGLHAIVALQVSYIWIGAVRMVSDWIWWRSIVRQLHIIALMHWRHAARIVAVHLQDIWHQRLWANERDRSIRSNFTWLNRCWNAGLLCAFMPLLSRSAFSAYSVRAFHGGWYDVTSSPFKFNGESCRTGELATIGMPCIAP